jgi:hypothetical protein
MIFLDLASAPNIVSATTAGGDFKSYITLKWSEPRRINDTITGYTILYGRTDGLSGNQSTTVGSSTTSFTIYHLLPYRLYTIFMRARTILGYGRWTSPIIIRTPGGGMY